MDKLIDFISWIAANVAPLALPSPNKKDLEEFNKQQPETSHPLHPLIAAIAIIAVLIIPVGFLILAFAV